MKTRRSCIRSDYHVRRASGAGYTGRWIFILGPIGFIVVVLFRLSGHKNLFEWPTIVVFFVVTSVVADVIVWVLLSRVGVFEEHRPRTWSDWKVDARKDIGISWKQLAIAWVLILLFFLAVFRLTGAR
jgi:hypothetical protein